MATPDAYAVRIYLNQVDVTNFAPYDKLFLEDYLHSTSRFKLVLENPSFTPTKDMELFIYNPDLTDSPTVFIGNVVEVEEEKQDDGIALNYILDCGDRKMRLLKSVVGYDEYVGLDTDILDDLLANAFPDLSALFDFSNAVNLADNLDLAVNDDNLLDLLDDLAEQAGADWSIEPAGSPEPLLITFDTGGWGSQIDENDFESIGYALIGAFQIIETVTSGGNPDNCAKFVDNVSLGSISNGTPIASAGARWGGASYTIVEISFDYYVTGSASIELAETITDQRQALAGLGAWHSHTFTINSASTGAFITFYATANINTSVVNLDLRLDNIRVTTTTAAPLTNPKDNLVWDSSPPAAPFNLDIDGGDEYGANFDLDIGGWDDYNAVIVTGGSEQVAIDWTYHGNQYQEHYPIEAPIKDLVVYKNTGSDASPTWGSALTLGKWGVDDIGTKDVLYDEANHWLLFNVALLNLNRAFRLTGSIKKPIRVLVENYASGDVVYATTIYDENATTPEAAANIGFAFLEDQNAIRRLNFETMHPGLKVGQAITVLDTARGLNEATVIQKISVKWIGASGHAKFEVECGLDEYADAGVIIAANDKRSRDKAVPVPIGLTTYSLLLDSDSTELLDSDGTALYGVA